ncbi:MAG: cytochrome c4 [Methylococcales bacterium]|nr:cytochrome c4 [Methylococcales bacterium]
MPLSSEPLRLGFSWQRQRRWKKKALFVVSAFALMASVKALAAGNDDGLNAQRVGSGNPVAGKEKSEAGRCQECHGIDGISSDAKIPNHAGQYADYLVKQLRDFQSGERSHATMSIMAEDLSATDMADIAAYFASLPIMPGSGAAENPWASNLFKNGDLARGIPACRSCHGDKGKGRLADSVVYPLIGGQRAVYLRSQLVNWKLGSRTNSPHGIMNTIAKTLGDDEISVLADYLSGL